MGGRTRIKGSRFVFGAKPGGFEAAFYADEQGNATGTVIIDESKEGPPGHAHGGSLATLIDEAMGAAAWNQGYRVLAANLNFNFRRPVPLNTGVYVSGRVERKEGRKIFTSGALTLPDGTVAVEGTGIFVEAPQHFVEDGYNPFRPEPSGDED